MSTTPNLLQKRGKKTFSQQQFREDITNLTTRSDTWSDYPLGLHDSSPQYALSSWKNWVVVNIHYNWIITMHYHRSRTNQTHLTQKIVNPDQFISLEVWAIARYFASTVDLEKLGCFLLLQLPIHNSHQQM